MFTKSYLCELFTKSYLCELFTKSYLCELFTKSYLCELFTKSDLFELFTKSLCITVSRCTHSYLCVPCVYLLDLACICDFFVFM